MSKPKCLMIGARRWDDKPASDDVFDYIPLDINPLSGADVIADAGHLPFKDESFEAVFASHVLEHLSPRIYGNVIEEWYRVLKPGGEMYIFVPNLALVAEHILTDPERTVYMSQAGPITALDMLFGMPGDGMHHAWGFTRESLARRAMEVEWADGLVWESRFGNPYDRAEVRLYGRKPGEKTWVGLDLRLNNTGDPYAIKLGGNDGNKRG